MSVTNLSISYSFTVHFAADKNIFVSYNMNARRCICSKTNYIKPFAFIYCKYGWVYGAGSGPTYNP